MFAAENLNTILGVSGILTIILLAIVIAFKMERIKQQQAAIGRLKGSLDEMDEQAKLIVRTDMELNKTQEELDKKVTGLYALQRLSRAISTTMQESEIFKRINNSHLDDLGFEKTCCFLYDEKKDLFTHQLNIGYAADEIEAAGFFVNSNKALFLQLINSQINLSSIAAGVEAGLKNKVQQAFYINSFVASPILPKDGSKGFFFAGTANLESTVTEGDEELINIMANQIGQALENARLFEKTWLTQQELEKKVEERTQELSRVLEEAKLISRRKTDFISSVSHELRTPLTSIKGYASILLAGKLGEIPPEIKERLEKIDRHSDELVHMVNDLLDIARIESGKMAMKQEPLELKKIIEGASDLLAGQLKAKEIEFSAQIAENANLIFVDHSQINRVLINLVGNALKFTAKQGKIKISAAKVDRWTQVDISDTGCGIPPEELDAVFEEFYRVDNPINQEAKGTGLGLSLVKHIVEAHKGKIWVRSSPGAGSTFSFTLPQPAQEAR